MIVSYLDKCEMKILFSGEVEWNMHHIGSVFCRIFIDVS